MQEPGNIGIGDWIFAIINVGLPGFLLFVAFKRITKTLIMRYRGRRTLGTVAGFEYVDGAFNTIRHIPIITYTTLDGQEHSLRYYRATQLFTFQQQVTVYYDPVRPWKYIIFSWKAFLGPIVLCLLAVSLLYLNLPDFLKRIL